MGCFVMELLYHYVGLSNKQLDEVVDLTARDQINRKYHTDAVCFKHKTEKVETMKINIKL